MHIGISLANYVESYRIFGCLFFACIIVKLAVHILHSKGNRKASSSSQEKIGRPAANFGHALSCIGKPENDLLADLQAYFLFAKEIGKFFGKTGCIFKIK